VKKKNQFVKNTVVSLAPAISPIEATPAPIEEPRQSI